MTSTGNDADQTVDRSVELSEDLAPSPATLSRWPLGHLPTPLGPMERVIEHLGAPRLHEERDGCIGLSSGGNQTRRSACLMSDAREAGAMTNVAHSVKQPHHTRQTTGAAAGLGPSGRILLDDGTGSNDLDYILKNNALPDRRHAQSSSTG